MTRRLVAGMAVPVLLVALAGCREESGGAPAPKPGPSAQQRLDDIESTLDSIESELNGG